MGDDETEKNDGGYDQPGEAEMAVQSKPENGGREQRGQETEGTEALVGSFGTGQRFAAQGKAGFVFAAGRKDHVLSMYCRDLARRRAHCG